MKRLNWLAASVAAMLMFACSSQKDPAEQAIAKIDGALDAIHDTAAKYSPDTLQAVQGQVATIKQSFAKGDYAAVLSAAPTVNTAIANLKQDANAKSAEADAALADAAEKVAAAGAAEGSAYQKASAPYVAFAKAAAKDGAPSPVLIKAFAGQDKAAGELRKALADRAKAAEALSNALAAKSKAQEKLKAAAAEM